MNQQSAGNPSIYDAATVCEDLLEDLLDQCTQSSQHDDARYDEAKGLFRRFNAWATRVGAVAPPKTSLDARLVDRPDFVDRVLELLAMIQQNIRKELLTGSAQKEHRDDAMDLDFGVLGLPAVMVALEQLDALEIAIRQSETRLRISSAGASSTSAPLPTQVMFYIDRVQQCFPGANSGLVEHVGRSMYMRGKAMLYQQRCNLQKKAPGAMGHAPIGRESEQEHTSTCSTNNMEYSLTEGKSVDNAYPKNPRTVATTPTTPCTLCYEPLNVNYLTDEIWREHVDGDVQPYVCLSEYCNNPFRFFTSAIDWKIHLETMHTPDWARSVHSMVWTCDREHRRLPDSLQQTTFHDKEAFAQHLARAHGKDMTPSRIALSVLRKKERKMRDPFSCLFCGHTFDSSEQNSSHHLYIHVAEHLKTLSLDSLAYINGHKDRIAAFPVTATQGVTEQRPGTTPQHDAEVHLSKKRRRSNTMELGETRIFRERNNMAVGNTYLYALDRSFPPGGPIALGNIVLDPLRPGEVLMRLPASDPALVAVSLVVHDWSNEVEILREKQGALFFQLAPATFGLGGFKWVTDRINARFDMTRLDTVFLRRKLTAADFTAWARESHEGEALGTPQLKNVLRRIGGTFYMISGIKIARGFQLREAPTEGSADHLAGRSLTPKDIVFAYELLRIHVTWDIEQPTFEVYELRNTSNRYSAGERIWRPMQKEEDDSTRSVTMASTAAMAFMGGMGATEATASTEATEDDIDMHEADLNQIGTQYPNGKYNRYNAGEHIWHAMEKEDDDSTRSVTMASTAATAFTGATGATETTATTEAAEDDTDMHEADINLFGTPYPYGKYREF